MDINLFADSLVYKLPNNELPANVNITVNMFPADYVELQEEMRKLPLMIQQDRVSFSEGTVTYRHEGINFNITNYGY